MSKPAKKILAVLAMLMLAGFIALNLLARNQARAMLFYSPGGAITSKPESLAGWRKLKVLLAGVNLPRSHGTETPADYGLAFESRTIAMTNGITLGAWYCPGSNQAWLVMLWHGYGKDKSGVLPEAAAFHELGYPVFLVDFRGSGESSESYTTVGLLEAQDVQAAIQYAQHHLPPAAHLLLYGQSMGAAAILRAIAIEGAQPDAVILEGVFDTLLGTVRNRFNSMRVPAFPAAELLTFWGGRFFGFNAFRHNPVAYAQSVACPILFIHATGDPRARLADARNVFNAVPGPDKRFLELAVAGHQPTVASHPAAWRAAAAQLMARSNP